MLRTQREQTARSFREFLSLREKLNKEVSSRVKKRWESTAVVSQPDGQPPGKPRAGVALRPRPEERILLCLKWRVLLLLPSGCFSDELSLWDPQGWGCLGTLVLWWRITECPGSFTPFPQLWACTARRMPFVQLKFAKCSMHISGDIREDFSWYTDQLFYNLFLFDT